MLEWELCFAMYYSVVISITWNICLTQNRVAHMDTMYTVHDKFRLLFYCQKSTSCMLLWSMLALYCCFFLAKHGRQFLKLKNLSEHLFWEWNTKLSGYIYWYVFNTLQIWDGILSSWYAIMKLGAWVWRLILYYQLKTAVKNLIPSNCDTSRPSLVFLPAFNAASPSLVTPQGSVEGE